MKLTLRFKAGDREERYLAARNAWLRPRVHRIVLMVGVLFAGFAPIDYFLAPDHYLYLFGIRTLIVLGLGTTWALYYFLLKQRPVTGMLASVAAITYLGILFIRIVVGMESEYEFSQGVMLVQIGVWLLGGFTFLAALVINVVGFLAFEFVEISVIRSPLLVVLRDTAYIVAASVLAGFAAYTIERFIRREFVRRLELEMNAMRDDVTGLWSHAAMDERLEHAVKRAGREENSGAVIMIDLDRFKPINDKYGHSAGDEVLISIARRIQAVVRPGDAVGRMGGDEFMVIVEDLPDPDYTTQLTARLRQTIESKIRVRIYGESVTVEVQVGASIGVAAFPEESTRAEKLIGLADKRMYADKAARGPASPER